MTEAEPKKQCPYCGNTHLYLCSLGAWNCPDCFSFVRKATKEERQNQLKILQKIEKQYERRNQ